MGHGLHIPLQEERIEYLMTMMVRALYFLELGSRLPSDIVTTVDHVHPPGEKGAWNWIRSMGATALKPVGDPEVFAFSYVGVVDDPFLTLWWLVFYRRVAVCVVTMTPAMAEKYKAHEQLSLHRYGPGGPKSWMARLILCTFIAKNYVVWFAFRLRTVSSSVAGFARRLFT
ncbi:MAG: hypothetical protein M3441_11115 [Chloroflexota bacterium]|nr:hypothetical protein [Chloroflexota bacterium]